jgi:anti-anti-sigma regulatory factor
MSRRTPVIIMDMTEVTAIEGGLEMLLFQRRWTVAHDMRLRLYNPSPSVRARLQQAGCISEITTLDEMVGLVVDFESVFATAA